MKFDNPLDKTEQLPLSDSLSLSELEEQAECVLPFAAEYLPSDHDPKEHLEYSIADEDISSAEIEVPALPTNIEPEVLAAYQQLLEACGAFGKKELAFIARAFDVAYHAHKGINRKSGEPYILHPIAVAHIVVREIDLEDAVAVACALLHDVVEDTPITIQEIERDFGAAVKEIVDGLTKIKRASKMQNVALDKAENLNRILQTLSTDMRVILVKIADRLHNMRTMDAMKPARQLEISSETLYIYAPTAHRLGLYRIKSELEDLCIKYTEPELYKEIAQKLQSTKKQREAYINAFIEPVKELLLQADPPLPPFRIFGRPKHIYSIRNKIRDKGVRFEEIFDLFAIRIVFDMPDPVGEFDKNLSKEADARKKKMEELQNSKDLALSKKKKEERKAKKEDVKEETKEETKEDKRRKKEEREALEAERDRKEAEVCWRTYGLIEGGRTSSDERLRNWLGKKRKKNGYESLHGTFSADDGKWVEVQIRTKRMDAVAEKGVAAHWRYKGGQMAGVGEWIENIKDSMQERKGNPLENLADFRLELYDREINVFTPKGDVRSLPLGATVLDFAFDIHTGIGCSCIGGEIDGKLCRLSHVLKAGDQVKIITSKKQVPSAEWLNWAITGKARTKIKSVLRSRIATEAKEGMEILERKLESMNIKVSTPLIKELANYFKFLDTEEFLIAIHNKKFDVNKIKKLKIESDKIIAQPDKDKGKKESIGNINFEKKDIKPVIDSVSIGATSNNVENNEENDVIEILGGFANGVDYTAAPCCNPINGDDVFGFITINKGITLHKTNCPNAEQLRFRFPYRIVNIKWRSGGQTMAASLQAFKINGIDDVGLVNRITQIISSELNINMRSIALNAQEGIFEGQIEVYYKDEKELDLLTQKLLQVNGIYAVKKVKL